MAGRPLVAAPADGGLLGLVEGVHGPLTAVALSWAADPPAGGVAAWRLTSTRLADTGAAMEAERHVSVPPGQTDPSSLAWSYLAAGTSLFVGVLILIMGVAHLYGVMVTATTRNYAYDFRLAALLLVGMALVFAAALCLSAVRGLARGQRAAWGRALIGTLLLLLVLVPLSPVQPDMAPGLSVLAAGNLLVLLAARRGTEAG